MKKISYDKRLFNGILSRFLRYSKKLGRLIADGANLRKQDILSRRLVKMKKQLLALQAGIRTATAAATVAGALFVMQPNAAQAQCFSGPPPFLTDIGGYSTPVFADLDNDGDLDAMSGEQYGGFFYFENTGTASAPAFGAAQASPFSLASVGYRSTVAFADLDNDGDLDLMSGEQQGSFYYFQNTGTSSAPVFAAPQTNPFSLVGIGYLSAPTFADLDNDGDLDLMSGETSGSFYYFENTGAASAPVFGAAQTNPFSLTNIGYLSKPTFGDLDGDGDFDVMSGEQYGNFFYFENTGSATVPAFAAAQTNPFGLIISSGYLSPVLADLDTDGDLDLTAGDFSGSFRYFRNNGTASVPAFATVDTNPFSLTDIGGYSAPAIGDLDDDGDLDVLAGESYGSFFYFENTGVASAAAYSPPQTNPFSLITTTQASRPALADLDNDGDLDLMSGALYGSFFYFQNTGSASAPAFAAPQTNPFSLTAVGYISSPTFADLDNDGDLDLMSGEVYSGFYYFENTGTASAPAFAGAQNNPFGLAGIGYYSSPALADLDGDGDFDLISGELYGSFAYFENEGSASAPAFDNPLSNPFSLTNAGNASAPALADLDDDGDFDLLSGENGGGFYYFENLDLRITSTTPGARCSAGIVALEATANGGILNWYAANTGGASLGTGATYLTPVISNTTTYYVESAGNGCISPRTAVVATINTPPTTAATPTDATSGNNNGAIALDVTGGTPPYIYRWAGPGGFSATTEDLTGLASGDYNVVVTDLNSCTDSLQVTVGLDIGIAEHGENIVRVYPNPAQSVLNIVNTKGVKNNYTLLDIAGKELFATEGSATHFTIDLSKFERGIYVLRIKNATHDQILRIVLQ